jgi:general secretion pathway protein D
VNTQFQYQDVGVNIEITPTVHFDNDVTLKIKIEVTAQSGSVTISGVTEPILSQRVAEQVIRLREGEANILGGIQEQQIQESWSGIPGLSSIPILRYLFGSKDHSIQDDEIVFLMVPHIVRSPVLTPVNLRTIDTGVGTSIELRRESSDTTGTNPAAAVPVRPVAAQPTVGTVPGLTAEAAAPAALAQLKSAAETNGNVAAANAVPASPPPPSRLGFSLNPLPGPVGAGTTFQIPVVVTGAVDIASVPLQIQYDPARLSLVNVDKGDFLGQDGQAVALVHRDDGPGAIVLNASRPPGVAGVSGAGVVCVLSFQAKSAGESAITITRPGAVTSAQKSVQAQGAQVSVVVK